MWCLRKISPMPFGRKRLGKAQQATGPTFYFLRSLLGSMPLSGLSPLPACHQDKTRNSGPPSATSSPCPCHQRSPKLLQVTCGLGSPRGLTQHGHNVPITGAAAGDATGLGVSRPGFESHCVTYQCVTLQTLPNLPGPQFSHL